MFDWIELQSVFDNSFIILSTILATVGPILIRANQTVEWTQKIIKLDQCWRLHRHFLFFGLQSLSNKFLLENFWILCFLITD